jgi:hypothetical protein
MFRRISSRVGDRARQISAAKSSSSLGPESKSLRDSRLCIKFTRNVFGLCQKLALHMFWCSELGYSTKRLSDAIEEREYELHDNRNRIVLCLIYDGCSGRLGSASYNACVVRIATAAAGTEKRLLDTAK